MTSLTVTLRDFGDVSTSGLVEAVPRTRDSVLSDGDVLRHGPYRLSINGSGSLAGQGTLTFPADDFPDVAWSFRVRFDGSNKTLTFGPYTSEQIADPDVSSLAELVGTEPLDSIPGNFGALLLVDGGSIAAPSQPVGSYLGYLVTGTATIAGTPVDPGVWVFVHEPDGWVGYKAGGGATVEPDTEPPGTPTSLTAASVDHDSAVLTATGATDDVAVVAYDYSIDGGTTWQQGNGLFAALTPETAYVGWAVARDAAGNVSAVPAEVEFTTAADPAAATTDTFGGTDGNLPGRVTATGGKTWINYGATSAGSNTVQVASGKATVASGGGGAVINAGATDVTVAFDYDVTASGSQVRAVARTAAGSETGVSVRIFDNGNVVINGAGITEKTIATAATTGRLGIKAQGDTLTFFANGTQLGLPVTTPATGTHFGIVVRNGSTADNFYCGVAAESFTPKAAVAEDDFTAADGTVLNGRTTPTGGYAWIGPSGNLAGLGFDLDITANAATQIGINGGGNAALVGPVLRPDMKATVTYEVTSGDGGSQVRVTGRSTASFTGVMLGIKGDGTLFYAYSTGGGQTILGTGQPTTGTMELRCIGSVGSAWIDGVRVGGDITLYDAAGDNRAALGIAGTGRALSYRAEWLA